MTQADVIGRFQQSRPQVPMHLKCRRNYRLRNLISLPIATKALCRQPDRFCSEGRLFSLRSSWLCGKIPLLRQSKHQPPQPVPELGDVEVDQQTELPAAEFKIGQSLCV